MEASVSASQGAMRSLPMKLESLLSGPVHRLRAEEKKQLRILQGELQGLIDNYLLEPSEVETPASTASSWMEGVRDLSYDIDDFIYELAHVAGGGARIKVVQKPPRFKISRFTDKLRRRQWITDDISAFRTRVKEAIRRHTQYLGNCKWRSSTSGQPPPLPPSGEAAIHLVGVDTTIKQLCGWLANDGQPDHKVASIIGAGGVGKTTLARQVYRKVGGQFDCLAFVRTSPKADMKGLLTSILSQVRRHRLPDDNTFDVHELVLNINTYLRDKTYLIVIEDLWALSTWDLVNRSLPKRNRCSRILTTTEVEVIAQACCADNSKCIPAKKEDDSRYIIKKEPLSEDESRELFLSTAFGKQAECPQHLMEVSNEIIKRSGGLPLAINILASLLARRQPASSIEQWHYIKNSLSPALITSSSLERINQVLNLGYDNLPHCLKACLLYLCLYEEDCIIWKDDLVKQWIAEDFICAVEGDDREEVACSYFCELVNRGMIQPVDINCNDEILSCTMHHMVLQFIRDKSMEENFCIAVEHSHTTIRLADKVRRLALRSGHVEDAMPPRPEIMRLSNVRSVAFSGFFKCMPSVEEFRFLQVLILKLLVDSDDSSCNLTRISELFRLRYFHLDACHMSVDLPTQMQKLKDLVAWEIYAEVTEVPSDIVDLPGLLYLRIPSEADLPVGIGRMTSLRTLGVFDLNKNSTETMMSLSELTNLQHLQLTCSTLQPGNLKKNLESLGSIVRKLRNLRSVTLVPSISSLVNSQNDAGSSSMIISWLDTSIQPLPPALLQKLELSRRCCIFSSLPEWTRELSNLCILKIALRKLSREDVAILKGLPSLAALSLFILTAPASSIIVDDEGFSVLKYFKFVCGAPCLEFLDGAMPKVGKLKLGFNANRLKHLDAAGFRRLTELDEISIKIGGADEHSRRLSTAIGEHPSTPIVNVKWVDWKFCVDDEMDIDSQREMWKWSSAKQGMTAGESKDEFAIQEKNLEEDANKQADKRTYTLPESTLHPRNTDIKLSIIEKNADRTAKKHEVDNDGYADDVEKMADVLPFPTVGPKSTESNRLEMIVADLDNIPKDSSNRIMQELETSLDESTLSLPHFEVRDSSDKCSINISLLEHISPVERRIDRLENVNTAEEGHSTELREKQKIKDLPFQWNVAAGRFVDDKEVLEEIVPLISLTILHIHGNISVNVHNRLMGLRQYLPNLTKIDLCDILKCNSLPPLGQLPNLQELGLYRMEGLEEWNTTHYSCKEDSNEPMFRKLKELWIEQCAKLRIKPCLPRAMSLYISGCDTMLSSWGESPSHNSTSSSSPLTELNVAESKVPMHEWRLLHQLPALRCLTITGCSDLTTSPQILHNLSSLESLCLDHAELPRWLVELTSLEKLTLCGCASMTLPEWLGELPSLKKFELMKCQGIRSFPDSIQQLTKLERLIIHDCPALEEWCELKENRMKLAHITKVGRLLKAGPIQCNDTLNLNSWEDQFLTRCDLYSSFMNTRGEASRVAVSHLVDDTYQGAAYMGMHEEHRVPWVRSFLEKQAH